MSKKEQENNSSKGESFHDSQTESESFNTNQNLSKKENNSNNNNNIIISDKEQNIDNNDHIAYDKRFWNLNEDLVLKKEPTNESKLSIDTPDISKQKLKEYLNEDLLNALDVSPMVTPKNILKNAANENINDVNNNENIITPSEDLMNGSNNDLFQFSLYNNNSGSKELFTNKSESISNNNPIDELIKISENNEDKNKYENQKDEEDYNDNEIMCSFSPPNYKINSISNDLNKNNDEINIIKEDEGGGNKNNIINNLDSSNMQNSQENNNNINKKENNINKFSKEFEKKNEIGESKKNNTKTLFSSQSQHPFIPHASHFQYPNQQHIIQTLQQNIHENKFDGKKYNLIIPIQTLKKNQKMKKPFEIREGDWTCSDCSNLNFAFRVKCNRCGISKEVSEQKRINNNNNNEQQEQGNNNIKDNNNNINNQQNYYSNVNMMPFKRIIFQSPLCNKGETFYPKYYIYVPFQGQYGKNIKEKKKEENNYLNKEKEKEKEKENITNDKSEQ